MGFFSSVLIRLKGFFLQAGDDIVSGSTSSIKATYRTIEEQEIKRYNQMLDAVSSLARQRSQTEQEIQKDEEQLSELEQEMEGALAIAEREPENQLVHEQAYNRAFTKKEELEARLEQRRSKFEELDQKVENYKIELANFQERVQSLKQEGDEAVADLISSESIVRIEQRLQGLSTEGTDQALDAVRRKVQDTKAKAQIASEIGGTDVSRQRERYRAAAKQSSGASEFSERLKQRQQAKTEQSQAETAEERKLGE